MYARFKDNIWLAGLAEMESLSSFNLGVQYSLKCSAYNEDKSIAAKRSIKTWKGKIYKKMTDNNCKSYLSCLNILVE